MLYEVVTLNQTSDHCGLFARTIEGRPDLSNHVKALFFQDICLLDKNGRTIGEAQIHRILVACTATTNLYLWIRADWFWKALASRNWCEEINGLARLEKLALQEDHFTPSPQSLSPTPHVFVCLTHLEVNHIASVDNMALWNFNLLPSLSHLRVHICTTEKEDYFEEEATEDIEGIVPIISPLSSLQVVLFELYDFVDVETDAFDPRLVMMMNYRSPYEQWLVANSIKGGSDAWTEGEKVVLKQRATRKQPSSRPGQQKLIIVRMQDGTSMNYISVV